MSIKKLVILGHPDRASFCGHLADTYVAAARAAGHEVSLMALGELEFDPVLRLGYKQIQPLEPDLLQLQEAIREAQQLVFIYPNWWGSMPALLKGMFDRLLLPGFAFHYQSPDAIRWQRLLSGRTAQAIVTMGKQLHHEIVAEGVENRAQMDFLRMLGCDQLQGYLFSPPVAAEKFEQILREERVIL